MPTSYEDLRSIKRLELLPILQFHVLELLKLIKRRISRRGKKRVVTSVTAAPSIIIPFFVAIKRDKVRPVFTDLVPSSLGRGHRTYKSGLAKFVSLQDLLYHIQEPLSTDVSHYFEKSLPQGGRAIACLSNETPAMLRYDSVRGRMSLSFTYKIVNRYGNVC